MIEYCNNYHIRVYKIYFTQNYDKPFQIICTCTTAKINLLVSTVARNSGNCNLIGHVRFYDCMVT